MSKKLISVAGLVIVAFIAFFIYQKYRVAPQIDLEKLSLVDLEGKAVNLSEFKGKKVLITFGASWCGNCREELDVISSIKETELSDVEVIVISDEVIEKISGLKNKRAYPFTFLKMNKTFSEIGINSIPTSYVVNRNLEIKKETVGYLNWKDPSTLQHLKMLMN